MSFLQYGLFLVGVSMRSPVSFVYLTFWVTLRAIRAVLYGRFNFCGLTTYPCAPFQKSFLRERIFTLLTILLVDVVNVCSRLPHHFNVFCSFGKGFITRNRTFCTMYFVVEMFEVTPHAPRVFSRFLLRLLFCFSRGSLQRAFRHGEVK